MLTLTRVVSTFPSVTLPSHSGGLPVEVSLISQLGHGAGDQIIASAALRQRGHAAFIDALEEPSARIGAVDLDRGDSTSLYTFSVGSAGHPFHRHAGHRVFTAISGSAGAQLRFSTASPAQIDADPRSFIKALHYVDIPPDCLFTVRFGGGTWHQFAPQRSGSSHPALFALSCHTDELGGDLPESLRRQVLDNRADIPSLTELLPPQVQALLDDAQFDPTRVATVALSVDAAAVTWAGRLCAVTRSMLGRMRTRWSRMLGASGFIAHNGSGRRVIALDQAPPGSLLREQFEGRAVHEDSFQIVVEPGELETGSARAALAALLQGFVDNPPLGVSRLMQFRNALVKPLGLRTSPLGCPVSSLLSAQSPHWFAGRFPVLAQQIDAGDSHAQVVLGADDKHLAFRSCVGVELHADGRAVFTIGTRVRTRNLFGRFYMAAINRVHRGYVTPAMLRLAVDHALQLVAGRQPDPARALALASG